MSVGAFIERKISTCCVAVSVAVSVAASAAASVAVSFAVSVAMHRGVYWHLHKKKSE